MFSITPIIKNSDGQYQFTVTTDREICTYDEATDTLHAFLEEETSHYHTNDQGQGLWRGDKQILGTTQFDLTKTRDRKGQALMHLLHTDNPQYSYEQFANGQASKPRTAAEARIYYRWLKACNQAA